MSIFSDIRDGFVTVVEAAITGLRIYPKLPDGLLEYPCMVVQPTGDVEYRQLIGADNILYLLKARLYLNIQDSSEAWNEFDEYKSPTGSKSIRAAVKTDVTSNASATYAEVVFSSEGEQDPDGRERLWEFSCEFHTEVRKNIA